MRSRFYGVLVLAAAGATMCLRCDPQANKPHSTVTIHVHRSGLFSAFGHDHVITAPIASQTLDVKANTVQITVETKQMRVTDPDVSEKDRAEIQSTMLGPKVLNAEKYPEIRFQSSHVEHTGAEHYRVTGKLELHGVSRELSFEVSGGPDARAPARAGVAGDRVGDRYHGKTRLKQTAFGIEPVSVAGGTVKVKDEVEIEFDVHATELASNR